VASETRAPDVDRRRPRVVVIDDERPIRDSLSLILEGEGYAVRTAGSAEDGIALLDAERADLVILDVRLPGMNGLEALREIAGRDEQTDVVMISGHATLSDAVEATRLGAFDFLQKPLNRDRVLITVRNALERVQLQYEMERLRRDSPSRFQMIGRAPVMQQLYREIEKVAPSKARVLITGENGSGKELIARSVHEHSARRDGPFVKVNCAAIPKDLIESELFGYERGAFSGAVARKRGHFEVAHGGTIFLDEIGDMALSAQAKVLRVLQTGEFMRVGGERNMTVDVRVLSATNKDLKAEVEKGEFREDLYFRLNVVPLRSPSLRERVEDIPMLVEAFIAETCEENGFRRKQLDPNVLELLERYHWPGNVRELRNLVERMVIMSDDRITRKDVPRELIGVAAAPTFAPGLNKTLRDFRDDMERDYIRFKLDELDWNVSKTADVLGLERTNLHKKMRSLGISRGH
jgi:two-component system nitrogen regulation response regulator NtrX